MLGLTPDQLVEMRSNGAIYGYRDGASWKFKTEEIERVAKELQESSGERNEDRIPLDSDTTLAASPSGGEDDEGSILVSEEELGHSGETTPSTLIGKPGAAALDENDLPLSGATGSDLVMPPSADTDLSLSVDPSLDSDVTLVPGVGEDSDVSLVPDPGSDRDFGPLGGSDLALQSASSGGTGRLESGSGDLGIGSDIEVAIDSELALSDDDELVLGGSGLGSDLTLGAPDSGINLDSPSDSGLSLEADSDSNLLSPSDSEPLLEDELLGSADSRVSPRESLRNGDTPAAASRRQLVPRDPVVERKEEEFISTPFEVMSEDESDSGSHEVEMLDSVAFKDESPETTPGREPSVYELGEAISPSIAAPVMTMSSTVGVSYPAPEAPYSVWNIVGLLVIVLLLSVSGIILTDIVQNMTAWEDTQDVSTGITDGLSSMFK